MSGLSCGIRLLEASYDVQIWAHDLPPHTTSNIAAAIWYPYKAYPKNLVPGWSALTYLDFVQLEQVPGSGVSVRSSIEMFPERSPTRGGARRCRRSGEPSRTNCQTATATALRSKHR